nr:hypothetical protein [Ferrimonas marina]
MQLLIRAQLPSPARLACATPFASSDAKQSGHRHPACTASVVNGIDLGSDMHQQLSSLLHENAAPQRGQVLLDTEVLEELGVGVDDIEAKGNG